MLQPMSEAKKDGAPILAKFREDLDRVRPDLERLNGKWVVIRNTGMGEYDDWRLAGPFGVGGWPDDWFAGWHPLPAA